MAGLLMIALCGITIGIILGVIIVIRELNRGLTDKELDRIRQDWETKTWKNDHDN